LFIAMNRFQVLPEETEAFETMWKNRESHLHEVPGFVEFHLLRGPEAEDHVLYASHTVWRDKAAFDGWLTSESFRKAHAGAGGKRPLYAGPPKFEGFEVIHAIGN